MNYADIKEIDIQDGEGVRVSLYVSGCHFRCKGCHNKEAWDFNYGQEFTDETIDRIVNLLDKSYIKGLSILGGEPLELANQKGLVKLVETVKEKFPSKTIWCWTGYDFEKDVFGKMYKEYDFTKKLLNNIDIIVDGQYEEENSLVNLKFRGSTNQKKIDVQASLKQNSVVRMEFGDESRYTKSKPKVFVAEEFKEKENNTEFIVPDINIENNNIIPITSNPNETIEIEKPEMKIAAKPKIEPIKEET